MGRSQTKFFARENPEVYVNPSRVFASGYGSFKRAYAFISSFVRLFIHVNKLKLHILVNPIENGVTHLRFITQNKQYHTNVRLNKNLSFECQTLGVYKTRRWNINHLVHQN